MIWNLLGFPFTGFFHGLPSAIVSRIDLASRTFSPTLDPLLCRDTKPPARVVR
jgi:hypothetical protein